ncbi:hypothetical protein [Bacillus phage vB_BceS-M2]|nr:hypothetical protein PBC5_005 [Bacillus phage PBC5]
MPNKKIKERELYTIVDGKQTDVGMHDFSIDDEFTKRINELYNTVKEGDKNGNGKEGN